MLYRITTLCASNAVLQVSYTSVEKDANHSPFSCLMSVLKGRLQNPGEKKMKREFFSDVQRKSEARTHTV